MWVMDRVSNPRQVVTYFATKQRIYATKSSKKMKNLRQTLPLSIAAFFSLQTPISAHTVNYVLEGKPVSDVFTYYVKLGFEHIIPLGLDHILFVVGLYLLSPKLKNIIFQATAFTVAHTLTLMMSMKNIIVAPPDIVEPIIALSIVFIAVENLITSTLQPWRAWPWFSPSDWCMVWVSRRL
jgi:hydrogenase/urease accessory protein HupE